MGAVRSLFGGQVAGSLEKSGTHRQHIVVALSPAMERALTMICEEEEKDQRTAAGYIRFLLQQDIDARMDVGWTPTKGWAAREEAAQ